MKTKILLSAVLLTASLLAIHADPAADVTGAAQKLANESNYSWHTTVVGPSGSVISPGPIDGKIQKDGLMYIKRHPVQNPLPDAKFSNLPLEIMMHGAHILVHAPDPDGGWETLADFIASDLQGPGPFVSDMMKHFQPPAAQAASLLIISDSLKLADGSYTGDLSADAAKKLLAPGNATVSNASGTVQFWINDGDLTKYEYKVAGTVKSGDTETQINRDTTVEIQNAGATTITVPPDAKKLLH